MSGKKELEVTLRIGRAYNLDMDQALRFGLLKVIRGKYAGLLKDNSVEMNTDPCDSKFTTICFSFVGVGNIDLNQKAAECVKILQAICGKTVEIVGLNPVENIIEEIEFK